jgi:hypothetical protein
MNINLIYKFDQKLIFDMNWLTPLFYWLNNVKKFICNNMSKI